MKLLELPDGMVSLEFESAEGEQLMRSLEQFGTVKRRVQPTYDEVSVGTVQLIHEHEWDEPCLISTSAPGASLLRQLASKRPHSKAA